MNMYSKQSHEMDFSNTTEITMISKEINEPHDIVDHRHRMEEEQQHMPYSISFMIKTKK